MDSLEFSINKITTPASRYDFASFFNIDACNFLFLPNYHVRTPEKNVEQECESGCVCLVILFSASFFLNIASCNTFRLRSTSRLLSVLFFVLVSVLLIQYMAWLVVKY